jgi:hypothetical protein
MSGLSSISALTGATPQFRSIIRCKAVLSSPFLHRIRYGSIILGQLQLSMFQGSIFSYIFCKFSTLKQDETSLYIWDSGYKSKDISRMWTHISTNNEKTGS